MQKANTGAVVRNVVLACGTLFLCLVVGAAAFGIGRFTAPARPQEQTIAPVDSAVQVPTRTPVAVAPTAAPTVGQPTPAGAATLPAGSDAVPAVTPSPTPVPLEEQVDSLSPQDLEMLFEVWERIFADFDGDKPTRDTLIDTIINSSLETLGDQNTRYIPPLAATRMREDFQGSFTGIGAYVRMTDEGLLRIVRPMSGQPAALAGLLPEDIILAANGTPLTGMTVDEAISYVRGPADTSVTLTIQRDGVPEPFDIVIVRRVIQIPTVDSEMLDNGIGYVHLWQFNAVANEQVRRAVDELLAQNPRGLIFDMRDNGGGFLNQAVMVADVFLDEGVVLYERGTNDLDETFRSQTNHPAENIPLVVLVNAGSASASELVAGAMQDRGRAVIIGETTFGKGSVQSINNLSNGAELRVTIARWYTPNNRSVDGVGIIPDIEVLPSPLEFGGPDDNQLQRAIQLLLEGQ
jgi:carboxyl-terminal processing protease